MKMTKERRWTIRALAKELLYRGYRSDGNIYNMMSRIQAMVTTTRSRSWESALDFIIMDTLGRGRLLLRRERCTTWSKSARRGRPAEARLNLI